MEDPHIRHEYEETLKANGVDLRMDPSWYERPAGIDWDLNKQQMADGIQ
jgi:hypothetical protein